MDNTRTPVLYIVGNYNIDLVMGTLTHWPAQGTEMMLEHSALRPGGSAGNYALAAGLKVADALAVEDASGDAAQTYANIIAVRNGDESSEKTLALVKALQTDAVKQFITETYDGSVVALF